MFDVYCDHNLFKGIEINLVDKWRFAIFESLKEKSSKRNYCLINDLDKIIQDSYSSSIK